MFGIKERFYEIQGLESDLLIGLNLLKKANVILDLKNETLTQNNKNEKIYLKEPSEKSI